MTRNEIAQLLMIGIPEGNDLSEIARLQPGGVVLMGRNAGPRAEVRRLTRAICQVCDEAPLIATDQEGGRVQRLRDGFTEIPPMRELAAGGANAVGLMAANVAAELRGVGIHVNFAPVCDVPVHPDDTIIGNRAFANEPIRAGLLAAEYIRGAQPTVMCVAKHFPGHGGVGIDSHQGLPTFTSTLDELRSIHLQPFRAALAAGVGAMMISHIAIPDLDATGTPASLSHPIITGLLRDELKFRGLVVTDDLEMGALDAFDAGDIAVRAIAAGNDLLLFCHSATKAEAAIEAVQRAVADKKLTAERVRDAIERVRWAKRKFGVLATT
ncbi:MAG: beta-N-acetylhexosaminidase [Abditibacteriota bacterium]|nr:beta-N-acetylhexosaminidase [Abditibacteriota bacterium]